jgi:phosphoribosylcarboxyaminoimidazole (NCAIR) mutase
MEEYVIDTYNLQIWMRHFAYMEECDVKVLLAGAGVAAEIGLPALKQVFDR